MAIFVKASRRGASIVKAYTRSGFKKTMASLGRVSTHGLNVSSREYQQKTLKRYSAFTKLPRTSKQELRKTVRKRLSAKRIYNNSL